MSDGGTGFWVGGRDAYVQGLRDEERELLEALWREFDSESDAELRRGLTDRIVALRAEFEEKSKGADSNLY